MSDSDRLQGCDQTDTAERVLRRCSFDTLTALIETGDKLARAAEQHWDEIPLAVALSDWEDARYRARQEAM